MLRSITFILLSLFIAFQSYAGDTWKLILRQSFYTNETEAEMLLHIPDEMSGENFSVSLQLNGQALFKADTLSFKKFISLPVDIKDLSPGTYPASAEIKSGDKNIRIKSELLILEPKANSVKLDRLTGGMIINDLPYFPFGFYCYSPLQPTLPEEEVVKGFNMFSPYQRITSKTREDRKAYLDRAAELGMKVHYNLLSVAGGGGVGSGRDLTSTQEDKRKLLREEIEAFMDHPAILAWYISDEPTGHGEDPEDLKNVYKFIKSIDPYHPITIVFMAPMQARRYADAMDIVMADPYPIPNSTPEGVGYVTRGLMNEFHGELPVWIVPQAFGGSEHWGREPSLQELRVMTYLSLANGATGIQYFIRHGLNGFPKSTAAWGVAGQIALEIQDITPFILEGRLVDLAETDQENIHLRRWEKDGQILLMAVNENIKPGPLEISLSNIEDQNIRVLFENRSVEINGGKINDFIEGYGRRVYLLGESTLPSIGINEKNMTRDPGFEDLACPGVPSSCYARVGNDRGSTYFLDSRTSVEGRHSMRMITPTENDGCSLGFFPLMVNSGTGYTLSVWAKYDSTSFRAEKQNFWQRLFKKEADDRRYFTLGLGSVKSEKFHLTNKWEKYTMTVYIPQESEESSRINPSLELNSQGIAWFDALEMYPDPIIEYGVNIESNSFEVKASTYQENAEIKYSLDGNIPDGNSPVYKDPVHLKRSADFTAAVFVEDTLYNYSTKSFFVHLATGKKPEYFRKYSDRYTAGGDYGLVDGIRGSRNYTDKLWQGFMANDLVATIDLNEKTSIQSVTVGCLQDTRSWIFMPAGVKVFGSDDGGSFKLLGQTGNDVSQEAVGSVKKDFKINFDPVEFRYIKVEVDNIGTCPDWHNGKGQAAFLFVDEIIVN